MKKIEEELKNRILAKWKTNKSWMKPSEYNAWIEKLINSEYHQAGHIDRIESFVGVLTEKKLLDVGSGEGGLVIALNLKSVNAYGIDLGKENIEISNLRAQRNSIHSSLFSISDAARLPFADSTFDIVISNKVLEHIKEQQIAIKEISRVLKGGGIFYLSVPNKWFFIEGHVSMWFPHWMPMAIRKPYLKKFRGAKAVDVNYLSDIHHLSPNQVHRLVKPYFSSISSKNIEAVRKILYNLNETDPSYFRMIFFMRVTKKLLEYPILRWLTIQLIKRFTPSITLVAIK